MKAVKVKGHRNVGALGVLGLVGLLWGGLRSTQRQLDSRFQHGLWIPEVIHLKSHAGGSSAAEQILLSSSWCPPSVLDATLNFVLT